MHLDPNTIIVLDEIKQEVQNEFNRELQALKLKYDSLLTMKIDTVLKLVRKQNGLSNKYVLSQDGKELINSDKNSSD